MPLEFGQLPGGGHPWGDIYGSDSSRADKVVGSIQEDSLKKANQLRQFAHEEKMLALKQKQELEEAATKEMKQAVRSTDVPKALSSYSDWRNANIDFDRNKKNMTRDQQLAAQQKILDLEIEHTKTVAGSKQKKAEEVERLKHMLDPKNTDLFKPEAMSIFQKGLNTPYDKLSNSSVLGADGKPEIDTATGQPKVIDYTAPSNYLYETRTDFAPVFEKAMGKQDNLNSVVTSKPNSLAKTTTKYEGFPSAPNYYASAREQLKGDAEKGKIPFELSRKHFIYAHGDISQEDISKTDAAYQEYIKRPEVVAAYGKADLNNFPNSDTEEGRILKYKAQQHALAHPPVASITETTDIDKKTAHDDAQDREKERRAHQWQKDFYDYKGGKGAAEESNIITRFINAQGIDGNQKGVKYTLPNGDKGVSITPPIEIVQKYTFKEKADAGGGKVVDVEVKPDDFVLSDDKKNVYPIIWQKNADGTPKRNENIKGGVLVNKEATNKLQKIPILNYRADLSKVLVTKKTAGEETVEGQPETIPTKDKKKASTYGL